MRTTPAKVAIALAAAGALLFGTAACGSDDPAPSGNPDSDGSITLYSGRNENLIGPLLEQFTAETGIRVEVRYGDTAQMAAQLLNEGDRTPADVYLAQDAGALGAVAKAGMFATLPQEVLDKVPATYRATDGEWVGVTGRSRVLIYNPDLVDADELPESVLELTEPQWRGRIGLAPTNGSFQAFVTALRVQHGDEVARDWLEGMAANDPQIREGNGPIVADVIDGRIEAGLVNHYYLFERAKELGVEMDEVSARLHYFPNGDTGALVNVSGVGVLAHAADNPDVRAFVDYLLSDAGQRYFTEETSEYPMTGSVTAPAGAPELEALEAPEIDLNDLDSLEETVNMITESGLA
jgi:iron(III) transport system substrate-binding protein